MRWSRPKGRAFVAAILAAGLLSACAAPQRGATLAPPAHVAASVETGNVWLEKGRLRPEAGQFLAALRAQNAPDAAALAAAVARAERGRSAAKAASRLLDDALVAYVQSRHRAPADARTEYIDPTLDPTRRESILAAARAAPSFADWLEAQARGNAWRAALEAATMPATPARRAALLASRVRAAALPADLGRRHLLVDIAGQQVLMIEDGREVGRMKVVVGREDARTPMLAARIDHVVLNPYWNLPQDLMRERVARAAAKPGGVAKAMRGFEALSDWSDAPARLDPKRVDWPAVAAGRQELRVRQLPGPDNFMGRVKFMLPNEHGIYLHDTPERAGFKARARLLSNGCVRVEDAPRLLAWLFDGAPPAPDGTPEQVVPLAEPVPVYMVYLTAMPQADGTIAWRRDVYDRDARVVAQLEREQLASR